MRTITKINLAIALSGIMLLPFKCYADMAWQMRELVGFTISASDSVTKTMEDKSGRKYVKLLSGAIFEVDFLLLDPLYATDVIIFSKRDSFKLLIDNEVYSAHPVNLRR